MPLLPPAPPLPLDGWPREPNTLLRTAVEFILVSLSLRDSNDAFAWLVREASARVTAGGSEREKGWTELLWLLSDTVDCGGPPAVGAAAAAAAAE